MTTELFGLPTQQIPPRERAILTGKAIVNWFRPHSGITRDEVQEACDDTMADRDFFGNRCFLEDECDIPRHLVSDHITACRDFQRWERETLAAMLPKNNN